MRNPGKAVRRWGLLSAVAIGCGVAPFLLYDFETTSQIPVYLTMIAVTLGPVAIALLINALVAARRLSRLRSGTELLARWRLPPPQWRAFVHADQQINAKHPNRMNTLTIRKRIPADGIEILIGEREIAIDGYVQSMRTGGFTSSFIWIDWLAGAPSIIECQFRVPRGRYSTAVEWLRFPVANDDRPAGMRVYQHFRQIAEQTQTRTSLAMRNPRRTLQVCGVLLTICIFTATWGFANRRELDPVAPLVAAVVGVIVGIGCLVMIAIVRINTPRSR